LFVVMQATGKIRWKEKFSPQPPLKEFVPPRPQTSLDPA